MSSKASEDVPPSNCRSRRPPGASRRRDAVALLLKDVRAVQFKMIIAIVDDSHTEAVLEAARQSGATGATVVDRARGEGLIPARTFFGLNLVGPRDVILLLVESRRCEHILERINDVADLERPGRGIAVQIDIERALGVTRHVLELQNQVDDRLD